MMDLTEVGDLEDMFDGIFMQAVLLHIPKKDVPNILESVIDKTFEFIQVSYLEKV